MTAQPRDPFDEDIEAVLSSELWARRFKVMFLRNGGVTWSQICKELQISETTARKDYDLFCGHITSEDPSKTTARHRAVIFDIQRAMYPKMMSGNADAAAVILRALERESRLLGLDSPTRVLANVSSEDFANEAARLITSIQQLDADTLKELGRAQGHDPFVINADPNNDLTAEIIAEIVEPEPAQPAKRAGRRTQRAIPAPRPAVAADGDSATKPAGRSRRSRGQKNLGRADGHGGSGDNAGDHSTHTDPGHRRQAVDQPTVDRLPDDDDDWSNL